MNAPVNLHATALVLRDRGIVITGPSGAGKTQLALALISHAEAYGFLGRLVADDQIFLTVHRGRLVASAPSTIAGLVEVRGVGPVSAGHVAQTVVDLVVRLVEPGAAKRFPDRETDRLLGCKVPLLELEQANGTGAASAVLARLSMAPFS